MGCHCSKDEDGEFGRSRTRPHPRKRSSGTLPETQTTLLDVPITHMTESELLKGFNVLHTDFIGERIGKIVDNYELLNPPLGKGACGEVRKAVHKRTKVVRAVKIINKDETDKLEQLRLVNEVNVLKRLDHPNIMRVFEFFQDEGHFYIVSEYLDGGELFDKIIRSGSFSEKRAAVTMKQILSAVSYCHDHNIVHRDLKPENILYESKDKDANIKIVDFGTSRSYDSKTRMKQRYGTPYYIAPEVLKGSYTEKCDVWSCGVILYVLLCGVPPFAGNTDREILTKVALGKVNFKTPEWNGISKEAKLLVGRMLEVNPLKRCTAKEALNDPWFRSVFGKPSFDKPLTVSALTNLRKLRAESKLQHAIWIFLVTYLATKEDQAKLLKTFEALDLNGDGQLSREELIMGYQTYMNSADPETEVDAIMQSVDINNSGAIDYTEFVIATINRQNMLKKEKLEALFKLIDKDGNGYLTADELEAIFNPGKHKNIDEKVWPELIKQFDINGDGKISLTEFKDMMSKLV